MEPEKGDGDKVFKLIEKKKTCKNDKFQPPIPSFAVEYGVGRKDGGRDSKTRIRTGPFPSPPKDPYFFC
jgi:hypothetical protein